MYLIDSLLLACMHSAGASSCSVYAAGYNILYIGACGLEIISLDALHVKTGIDNSYYVRITEDKAVVVGLLKHLFHLTSIH